MRHDGRRPKQLREVVLKLDANEFAEGSCLVEFGRTKVNCTATVDKQIPRWRNPDDGGWVTGEYDMLPRAARERSNRGGGRGGRAQEISRLIGRSLRAVVDLAEMPGLTITVDCDVLQADGGTRTAAITGGFVALVQALRWCRQNKLVKAIPLADSVSAISVGLVNGQVLLDLDQHEDNAAAVDANFVITGQGRLVEVQISGEEATFTQDELNDLLAAARIGAKELAKRQNAVLGPISSPAGK